MYDFLEDYLRAQPGAEEDYKPEWGWQRFQVGGKLFGAICTPGAEHKEYAGRTLINLKCDPVRSELLRAEYPDIRPGFYMNKKNWIAVFLDGTIEDDLLKKLCDESYQAVFSKLTKKQRLEIQGE